MRFSTRDSQRLVQMTKPNALLLSGLCCSALQLVTAAVACVLYEAYARLSLPSQELVLAKAWCFLLVLTSHHFLVGGWYYLHFFVALQDHQAPGFCPLPPWWIRDTVINAWQ